MHYTKPVFRPAFEGDVLLLQVTDGCRSSRRPSLTVCRTGAQKAAS